MRIISDPTAEKVEEFRALMDRDSTAKLTLDFTTMTEEEVMTRLRDFLDEGERREALLGDSGRDGGEG